MKKLSQREIMIAGACVFLILGFAVTKTLGTVSLRAEKDIIEDIEREKARLAKYVEAAGRKVKIDKVHENFISPYMQEGSQDQVTSKLVADVQEEASKFDVQILNLKPERVNRKDIFIEYPIRMTVTGSWEKINEWVHQLQQEPYLLDVTQMRLEKSTSTSKSLKARLTLTYFRVKL